MDYHFVRMRISDAYLSLVDPRCKTRFMCFKEKYLAEKCINYVSTFKGKYGIWPVFDMSSNCKKEIVSSNIKIRNPDDVKQFLDIVTYDYETIEKISSRTNASYYCVLAFNTTEKVTRESVNMSGQEMDAILDEKLYRDVLEYNLNISE